MITAHNAIKITQYRKNGHGYSLYQFKDQWKKEPKPLLMIHTDIIFEDNYLDNIINDKKENIIGIKDVKNHILKKNSFVVKEDNKRILNNLEHYKYQQSNIDVENDTNETLKKELLKAIKNLVEHQQTVLRLFYVEAYSLKEIGNILNIPVGTAKSRLFHAREKLKETLKEKRNEY